MNKLVYFIFFSVEKLSKSFEKVNDRNIGFSEKWSILDQFQDDLTTTETLMNEKSDQMKTSFRDLAVRMKQWGRKQTTKKNPG